MQRLSKRNRYGFIPYPFKLLGRQGHATVAVDGHVYLMGGFGGAVRFNDLWKSSDCGEYLFSYHHPDLPIYLPVTYFLSSISIDINLNCIKCIKTIRYNTADYY